MDNISNRLTDEEEALLDQVLIETHENPSEKSDNIPTNSPTILLDEYHSRFSSAQWFNEAKEATIILAGLGGIGSWTALLLSRLDVNKLVLYDSDIVENSNLSGQLYKVSQARNRKVDATTDNISSFSNYNRVVANPFNFSISSSVSPIMIGGFDNMGARKVFFEKWADYVRRVNPSYRKRCLFIDARLAAEEFQVFCIKGTDTFLRTKYEREWLFNDDEAEETICSYKQTSFCANMVASVIVNLFVNFITNNCEPLIERELPFYTNYNAETMQFKTYMV